VDIDIPLALKPRSVNALGTVIDASFDVRRVLRVGGFRTDSASFQ